MVVEKAQETAYTCDLERVYLQLVTAFSLPHDCETRLLGARVRRLNGSVYSDQFWGGWAVTPSQMVSSVAAGNVIAVVMTMSMMTETLMEHRGLDEKCDSV